MAFKRTTADTWEARTQAIFAALPATQEDLRIRLGASQASVCRWLEMLRGADRRVYISEWRRAAKGGRGNPVAIYSRGNRPDVPCPFVPTTSAERKRKYVERIASRGVFDNPHVLGSLPRRDFLTECLFGTVAESMYRCAIMRAPDLSQEDNA